jgi:hypothetical protein
VSEEFALSVEPEMVVPRGTTVAVAMVLLGSVSAVAAWEGAAVKSERSTATTAVSAVPAGLKMRRLAPTLCDANLSP